MASPEHCIYCFEVLASNLEDRDPLSFEEVEASWQDYQQSVDDEHKQTATISQTTAKPFDEYPIFVTWDTISSSGTRRLRGCKGTFTAAALSQQLEDFALIAALEDHRFKPIVQAELSKLTCGVTILHSFQPTSNPNDPLDWTVGKHGIRVAFRDQNGKRYGATFLPDVMPEQGWTQEDAIEHAVQKAGWKGEVEDVQALKVTTYEGWKAKVGYDGFLDWRLWLENRSESVTEEEHP